MTRARRRRRFAATVALTAGAAAVVVAFSAGPAPSRHARRHVAAVSPARTQPRRRTVAVARRPSKHPRPHRRHFAAPAALEKTSAPAATPAASTATSTPPVAAKPAFDPRFYGN
jgi:hypothetical protein